jgi:mycothiol synthase
MTAETTEIDSLRAVILPADAQAVVDLFSATSKQDKVPWFPTVEQLVNDWSATGTFDPGRDLQALEVDGRLAGIARHSWRERPAVVSHRVEVYVHPEHRRRGYGRRLLAWAEARARATAADGSGGPTNKPHQFGSSGPDSVPAVAAFAGSMGYEPYRYHFEMRRPLADPIREAPLPAGLEVRPVTPEHHRAIWDADEEAFRDHWDHAEPVEGDFERFFGDPDIDPSLWQVAWDGDQVAGLVINTIYPHENRSSAEEIGWVDSVATRRPWRGRGVAAALIARSLAVLRDRGMEIAALGVDAENPTGALGLYESFGFQPARRWVFYRKPF